MNRRSADSSSPNLFNGRATLDSGMKIHARVELEGQNNHSDGGSGDDPIDEYFLSVSGSFGQIVLGGTGGAPVRMLIGLTGSWATGVGETLSFDVNGWLPTTSDDECILNSCFARSFYALRDIRLDTGDAEKVTYISPKLGGFQVGLTYSPNRVNNDSNARVDTSAGPHDGIEGAVSYSGKFGDVGIGLGAGMTKYKGVMGDGRSSWLLAGRIDFGGGFRVAIGHKRVTNDYKTRQSSLTDAGVRFVHGANSFSLAGSQGEMKKTPAWHISAMASYARALGPGVKWHANLIRTKSQSRRATFLLSGDTGRFIAGPPSGNDYNVTVQTTHSGTALVTGIKAVF